VRKSVRNWMQRCARTALVLLLAQLLGCGTLLYRERVGQPRGKLDVVVVLLDSIGLVYFVAPGLVAFAVDFATGAIYLPRQAPPSLAEDDGRIQVRMLGESSRDPRAIEQAVHEATGVELAGHWDELQIWTQGTEPLAQRLLELDARAQGCAGLDPAAEPRAPAFRSCAPR
jgi:hypothetical protein